MQGIYNRNNMDLQAAIEAALKNRQQFELREEKRRQEIEKAASTGVKAIGDDIYSNHMGQSDEDLDAQIAKLQDKLAEAKEQEAYKASVEQAYNDQVARRNAVSAYIDRYNDALPQISAANYARNQQQAMNNYAAAMGSRDYQGYHTTPASVANSIPDYSEILKRRGLY